MVGGGGGRVEDVAVTPNNSLQKGKQKSGS